MALTSLSAVASTFVAGPTGRTIPVRPEYPGEHRPFDLAGVTSKLPPLSKQQVQANIERDVTAGILTKLPEDTGYHYKFDPKVFKEKYNKTLDFAHLKQLYGIKDGTFAQKELVGQHGNLDTIPVDRPVNF